MEYGSESGCVWNMALRVECVEYGSESGCVWNMALRVEVCGIWLCEWRCVEYGSESGVCGIWL